MTKSIIISTLFILCAIIIETSILANISFLYVVPDLVLICSVYFSLLNGKLSGEVNGFISGMLLDFVTGIPFGFNCFYRTLLGYFYGLFTETVKLTGLVVPVTSVALGTVFKSILISFTSLLFPNANIFSSGLISNRFLFELIINVILAPLVFKFLSFFNNSLSINTTRDKVDNV